MPDAPAEDRPPEEVAELEFGKLTSTDYLYVSQHPAGQPYPNPVEDDPPIFIYIVTYLSYLILIIIGHIRDFFGKIFRPEAYEHLVEKDGYAPWSDGFESFYERRLKERIDDCFARPIHGAPGRYIKCYQRIKMGINKYQYTGGSDECLNLSSYNYLGFGQSKGTCTEAASEIVDSYGTSGCSPRDIVGTTDLHQQCERLIADFVGQDDAILVSQGYGTNAFIFECIADSKTLVLSDALNHASTRFGVRVSGASVKVFEHNDMKSLEKVIRNAIAQGQPKSHRPWSKIIIAVEGLYSMEGDMCNLVEIIRLKEKYKCYLFVDEAHSIGALGPNGRGISDYFGVDPKKIDVLMGTLTKSFGATGGYISGSQKLMDRVRVDYATNVHGESVPPPVLAQIISSMSIIKGDLNPGEGALRLQRLAFNSRYFRSGLKKLGFIIYGADDSPVIPLLVFLPAKMPAVSRKLYDMGIALVIAAYPATPIVSGRVRLCLSSALTKEDLDYVLEKFSEIGDLIYLKFGSGIPGQTKKMNIQEALAGNVEMCKQPNFGLVKA
ncbi:palmitoyl transferase [Yamadazyma tenuis ATCC 10573]|nr:palmitoyl transferase [Yamadazyma tenuis ATCC 10573]EGV60468.1 palmitoyl transferase [Yamadazyma tenuis ATCC 10573]